MKKENQQKKLQLQGALISILCTVEDEDKQSLVINVIKECEEKLHDSKIKDLIDNLKRKNLDYYGLVESYVNDIFEKKLKDDQLQIIKTSLDEIKAIIEYKELNWFETLWRNIGNALGKIW